MSSLRIEERFQVDALPDMVWRFLIDVERVVVCLPGAQLTEIVDDETFKGKMRVKVGPVTMAYKGKVVFTELDHHVRRVAMRGQGREKAGGGTAKMTMVSTVKERSDGGCEVVVESSVDLAGRIVRFGRGMIKQVSKQLFKQFSACVQKKLNAEAEQAAAAAPVAPEAAAEAEVAATAEATEAAEREDDAAARPAEDRARAESGTTPTAAEVPPGDAEAEEAAPLSAPPAPSRRPEVISEAEPIRAIPLFFKALWASLLGFFRRVLRREKGEDG
jgi:hypothetical protein